MTLIVLTRQSLIVIFQNSKFNTNQNMNNTMNVLKNVVLKFKCLADSSNEVIQPTYTYVRIHL